MARQALFKDLMSAKSKPQKKPTNHFIPIYCSDTPTPKKQKGEFEVIE